MGTYTAQILVGDSHPYHGGILPTHQMFLSENDRAAWILRRFPTFGEEEKCDLETTVWVPAGPSTIFRDGLMIIAYHIIKDKNFRKEAKKVFGKDSDGRLDLNFDYKDEKLIELFEHCLRITYWPKVVVSILDGSSLENSRFAKVGKHSYEWEGAVEIFNTIGKPLYRKNNEEMDVEVCVSEHIRRFKRGFGE